MYPGAMAILLNESMKGTVQPVHLHVYVYIYIYIEREREREREIHKHIYIYIYIYVKHTYAGYTFDALEADQRQDIHSLWVDFHILG